MRMRKTAFGCAALAALLAAVVGACAADRPAVDEATPDESTFSIVEATIPDMQAAMRDGRTTSRRLVTEHLARIARYEAMLNAVITLNPRALDEADARDRERAAGLVRGPLHGIPVALKDNIQTLDMPTTGGSLAFDGFVPPYEATVTRQLREAGAVIVAKTGMTELANWVAGPLTPMPGNYNALTGFGFNPYDPRRLPNGDGRPVLSPGGSSSGIGTAASFWAANVGTETSGSILTPAVRTMLVGVKPTVGRVSRYGIMPITSDQDTAGPMARTVMDAAILLGALEGEAPDPNDPATSRCEPPPGRDYTRTLRPGALSGARIGVPRAYYYVPVAPPGGAPRGGLGRARRLLMDEAIAALRREGAVVIDPATIPSLVADVADDHLLGWGICLGIEPTGRASCSTVLLYGMKRDFNRWLSSLGGDAPVASLTELRRFNRAHRDEGAINYGQSLLDASDRMDLDADRARYESDRARDLRLARGQGLDAAMGEHDLEALLFPGSFGADLAARAGYPTVTVPFGTVPNADVPPGVAGFDPKPEPFGVSFTGGACAEPRLLELAFAFEQATRGRVPPELENDEMTR
jgi:amidase